MKAEDDSAKVQIPPPLIYLAFLLLGYGLGAVVSIPSLGLSSPTRNIAAAGLSIGGFSLIAAPVVLFRSRGTNVEPWKSSNLVVTDGLYRWTRNPMYLGMAILYAGLAVGLDSLAALALLPALLFLIQTRVIAREERYLEVKFGEQYRSYRAQVRRWL